MNGPTRDRPAETTDPEGLSVRRALLDASSLGLGQPCPFCGAILVKDAVRCPQCRRVVVKDSVFD